MRKYYFHNGTFEEGPFTVEELKAKGYTEVTPIWYEGLQDWVPAGYLDELKVATPPPYTKQTVIAVAPPPPPPKPAIEQVPTKRKKTSAFKIISYVLGALLLLWLGAVAFAAFQEKERQKMEELDKANVRNNLETYITAERNQYTYYPIGGIENLKITVHNQSDYPVDEVKVQVNYIKTNGSLYKTEILTADYMLPNSSLTLDAPNSNRGTEVSYKVISVKSKSLGLY